MRNWTSLIFGAISFVLMLVTVAFADRFPALAITLMLPSVGLVIYLQFVDKEQCDDWTLEGSFTELMRYLNTCEKEIFMPAKRRQANEEKY